MIQYVLRSYINRKFEISHTANLIEASMSNTVFSCIVVIESHIIVAGFDIDRHANMIIVLDDTCHRLFKIDTISNDDGMPIVNVQQYHDDKLGIKFVISSSIRSVYVHCMNVKTYEMTQIFDRSFDDIVINGMNFTTYDDGKFITLMIYGQHHTRGEIVHMKLKWNVDEISKLE